MTNLKSTCKTVKQLFDTNGRSGPARIAVILAKWYVSHVQLWWRIFLFRGRSCPWSRGINTSAGPERAVVYSCYSIRLQIKMDLQISRQAAILAMWLTLLLLVARVEYGSTQPMQSDCICTKRTQTAAMLTNNIHYICCDVTGLVDASCDGNDYVAGSPPDLCGSAGADNGGGIRPFVIPCGNCDVQTTCASRCDGLSYPQGCSLWTKCFTKCCKAALDGGATTTTEVNALTFCGDGTCGGGESGFCSDDCCDGSAADCRIEPCIFNVPTENNLDVFCNNQP